MVLTRPYLKRGSVPSSGYPPGKTGRLLLRFDSLSQLNYALKTTVHTVINPPRHCRR
jgi:hypothetical protein